MARIRTIKPEYFTSLSTAELSWKAFALFPGLLTHSDDEGRFVNEPRLLKAALAPLRDDVTAEDFVALTEEYVRAGMVVTYTSSEGVPTGQIVNFNVHQRVNRPTPSKLEPPPPKTDESEPAAPPTEPSQETHTQLSEPSPLEGKGKEQGREQDAPPDGGVTRTVNVEGFDRPFPIATRGTPLTDEIVTWARDAGLAEIEFRTALEDALLAVETIAGTIGRKGPAIQAAIAVVGDYYEAIRHEPLNRRSWGMVQSAVANHGPTAVLNALAEALQHGAGLDGGHEDKGPVAVIEYALAVLRGERGNAA